MKMLNITGNILINRDELLLLALNLFFLQSISLFSQVNVSNNKPYKIKGNYEVCNVYSYKSNSGKLDSNSKIKEHIYLNESSYQINNLLSFHLPNILD